MSDIEINRGIELLLNGGKQKEQPKPKPETLKVVLDKTVSFLRREIKFYFKINTYHENNEDSEEETYSMHPELMYDEHGNLLTDQLIAFKFDNSEDIEPLDD